MIEKNISDESLKNDPAYLEFLRNNPGNGFLKIRASAANEAVPISGIQIKVTKLIGNTNVVFFEGQTDGSGMINNISLPAPAAIASDEDVPQFTDYNVSATGSMQDLKEEYSVAICCGITVIQYISVTPMISEEI